MAEQENPLKVLAGQGQSVWYDNIHRAMLHSGELMRLIETDAVTGITSNPAIFEKAITGSAGYDDAIRTLLARDPGRSARDLFYDLALEDIQHAADRFRPVYEATGGRDGFVSLEVSPDLAYEVEATVAEAIHLWERLDRPNAMIKVPATQQGVAAFEALVAEGINVNVTLLFSVARYEAIAEAYIRGLQRRHEQGLSISGIASVASFFVSRVDAALSQPLSDAGRPELGGVIAIANAKLAYRRYQALFGAPFAALAAAGAQPQRLLWASTSTKDPAARDVLYVESLIGPETVNTLPPATLEAFRDHGVVAETLTSGVDAAASAVSALNSAGIDLTAITDRLEADGVGSFADAFRNVLAALDRKSEDLAA